MTADLDPIIAVALDHHVPAQSGATADWTDVARRAATRGRRLPARLRDRRVWFGIGAVAVALGCVGAIEHHRIYRLFGADEPTTGKAVEQRLLSAFRWPRGLHVIESRSRLVFQLRQPAGFDSQGPTAWTTGYGLVAPLSNGAVCLGADVGMGSNWGCSGRGTGEILQSASAPAAWHDAGGRIHLAPFVFWGIAPGGTASMALVDAAGEHHPVPLSPIRLPGRVVFALRVPRLLETAGHRPTALIARTASGQVIARLDGLSPNFTPVVYNAPVKGPGTVGSGRESGTLITLRAGGVTHRFRLDRTCLYDDYATRKDGPVEGVYCGIEGGLVPFINPIADRAAIAWGRLPSTAATITIRYAHHSEQAIVYDHSYLFPVSTTQLRAADLPLAVVARTASGAVVGRQSLARSLFPGY